MGGKRARVLAIDPTTRGFCFALLEGSRVLVDWGCSRLARPYARNFRRRIDLLLVRFEPDVVVLEDPENNLLGRRARRRIVQAGEQSIARDVYVETVTRGRVQEYFGTSGATKWDIACAIAEAFPELRPRLPRQRKLGMIEDERMSIFDAVSFSLVVLGDWERRSSE